MLNCSSFQPPGLETSVRQSWKRWTQRRTCVSDLTTRREYKAISQPCSCTNKSYGYTLVPRYSPAAHCHLVRPLHGFHLLISQHHSGAGIGGLALAVVLGKFERADAPLEVTIYERYPEVPVFGAGISVWQRTWRVMELLGLNEELSAAAERPLNKNKGEDPQKIDTAGIGRLKTDAGPGFVYRRSDRTENNYTFYRIMMPCKPYPFPSQQAHAIP